MADEAKAREWYSVKVVAEKASESAIETAFVILNSLGTETDAFGIKSDSAVSVVGYFDSMPESNTVHEVLERVLAAHGCESNSIRDVSFGSIVEQDWLAEWKKYWRPTLAGMFLVAPPWEQPGRDDKILITIEPAMAFGTGTHESTRLCLELISKYFAPEMSFLDVGTGTGILAIAAAKLSSASAYSTRFLALDTDEHAVKAAAENAELNDVSKIEFQIGSVDGNTPSFDLVCANMTIDIIKPMLPLLIGKADRKLILSGILAGQEAEIKTALSELGIDDPEVSRKGEWVAVTASF